MHGFLLVSLPYPGHALDSNGAIRFEVTDKNMPISQAGFWTFYFLSFKENPDEPKRLPFRDDVTYKRESSLRVHRSFT